MFIYVCKRNYIKVTYEFVMSQTCSGIKELSDIKCQSCCEFMNDKYSF